MEIVAIDAGNAGTNAVLATKKGKHRADYFPSVRAKVAGASLGLGKEWELDYPYYEWGGHKYIVGDDVLRVSRRSLERHMGANRYANEFQQFLVTTACARLGLGKGGSAINLTLFAPPGYYAAVRPLMIESFQDGPFTVSLRGEKEERSFTFEKVNVWPEGLGAAACFILDDKGHPAQGRSPLAGRVLILDIGAYTLDALEMVEGNFNPESLIHATWERGGVDTHIRQPLLAAVQQAGGEDFLDLTVDDIDRVIRLGLVSGEYLVQSAGSEVNLCDALEKYVDAYAGWIANNIIDGQYQGLRGINALILVGGGAALVEGWLKKWYPQKVLDRRDYAATKKVDPVDMNAVGGMRLALMANGG